MSIHPKVIIFSNDPIATQSGKKNAEQWFLKFIQQDHSCYLESCMGWTSSEDMNSSELCISFSSQELAIDFAKTNNFQYQIFEKQNKKISPKSYGENFKNLDYK